MATSIGSVREFDPDLEDWMQYAERLGHYLTANGIDEVDRSGLADDDWAKAYKLLRTLVSPEKPGDKTYNGLVAAMQQHHSPKPSPIVQRYRFNSRLRREGESVAQYFSELRALSEFCDFGPSLDDMLRDRSVCGVGDQTIQRKLLAEEGLTLKRATDIALAMETAARNAATLQGQELEGMTANWLSIKCSQGHPPLHPTALSLHQPLEHATGVGRRIILPPNVDTKIPNASAAGRSDIWPECVGAGTSRVPSSHSP